MTAIEASAHLSALLLMVLRLGRTALPVLRLLFRTTTRRTSEASGEFRLHSSGSDTRLARLTVMAGRILGGRWLRFKGRAGLPRMASMGHGLGRRLKRLLGRRRDTGVTSTRRIRRANVTRM